MKELRAITFYKGIKKATITTSKYNLLDTYEGEDGQTHTAYKFEKLTQEEMDTIARTLRENDIPFKTFPQSGYWLIVVNEPEIDALRVDLPNYELLSKEELLMVLYEKETQISELKEKVNYMNYRYSKLYEEYNDPNRI